MTEHFEALTAHEIWRAFVAAEVTHVVGVPDSQTDPIFARACGDGPVVVTVCREGEALGIAAGLWAGGRRPIVLVQSTGLFEAGDSLRSFHGDLELPLDLVVGWRGRSGKLNAGYSDTAAPLLLPTLDAWRVPYQVVTGPHGGLEIEQQLRQFAGRERGCRALVIPQ